MFFQTSRFTLLSLLCLVKPILKFVFDRFLWNEPHIFEANDQHFLRMKGLRELSARTQYKQDIVTGDIVQHILQSLLLSPQ
jgi:hypothetical protein